MAWREPLQGALYGGPGARKLIKNYIEYTHIYIYIYCVYIYIYGAKHSPITLNIEKWCFLGKLTLEVFDFKQCDDFSVNIKFPQADQNLLQRRTLFYLHVGLVFLKLLGPHASFAHLFRHVCWCFQFCVCWFLMQTCMWL